MKKILFYVLALALFSLTFGCVNQEKEGEKEVVKIGLNLPLSGNLSFYGTEVKNGFEVFKELTNDTLIEFIIEDNQSKANLSVSLFNKMVNIDGAKLIISCNSPLSLPLRPLAESNQTPLIAMVTGAKDFGLKNTWSYRDAIRQEPQGEQLADFILNEITGKRGVTYVINDDYGLDGATSFTQTIRNGGGEIIASETFEQGQRDMRNTLSKLLSGSDVNFILLIGREETLISAVKQIREINKNILILSTNAFDSENVITALKNNLNNIVFTSNNYNLEKGEGLSFRNFYVNKYDIEPSIYAIDAFVAGKYLHSILSKNKFITANEIREKLSKLSFNSPIRGELFVNDKRDIVAPIALFTFKNDKKILQLNNEISK